jgi:hypothetical protein
LFSEAIANDESISVKRSGIEELPSFVRALDPHCQAILKARRNSLASDLLRALEIGLLDLASPLDQPHPDPFTLDNVREAPCREGDGHPNWSNAKGSSLHPFDGRRPPDHLRGVIHMTAEQGTTQLG